jgi:hypothetical protein
MVFAHCPDALELAWLQRALLPRTDPSDKRSTHDTLPDPSAPPPSHSSAQNDQRVWARLEGAQKWHRQSEHRDAYRGCTLMHDNRATEFFRMQQQRELSCPASIETEASRKRRRAAQWIMGSFAWLPACVAPAYERHSQERAARRIDTLDFVARAACEEAYRLDVERMVDYRLFEHEFRDATMQATRSCAEEEHLYEPIIGDDGESGTV